VASQIEYRSSLCSGCGEMAPRQLDTIQKSEYCRTIIIVINFRRSRSCSTRTLGSAHDLTMTPPQWVNTASNPIYSLNHLYRQYSSSEYFSTKLNPQQFKTSCHRVIVLFIFYTLYLHSLQYFHSSLDTSFLFTLSFHTLASITFSSQFTHTL